MKKKNIYMIGIKGVGMTMLAQFLATQGHKVSGSDIEDVFLTDKVLKKEKIKVFSPFCIDNIPSKVDLVIYSSAFTGENNVELKFIDQRKEIEVKTYAKALGGLFNQYQGIAVCGSHGKTTVSAWLGYVLYRAGKNPNVLVGSRVPQFKGSSLLGKSKMFVAEVDEYQNKLQHFNPWGVLLNNIDFDHPDFFKTKASYQKVFIDFIKKIPATGFLVCNNNDPKVRGIKKYCSGQVISYSLDEEQRTNEVVNYLAYDIKQGNGYQSFQVNNLGRFKIKLWGDHSIYNALAVIVTARELKVSLEKIKKHLAEFGGTERRAQVLGEYRKAVVIDDYAHHPVEIMTTLKGLKRHYKNKNIITVFHPHTFTRTKALFKDFVKSFQDTNELIVLDIYGSAREKQGGVSSIQMVKEIKKYNQTKNIKQKVGHIPTIDEAVVYLRKNLKNNDLVLLMGAGDVFRVGEKLLKR